MEEYHLIEEDILNKDYFENIRNMVTCFICLNIMEDPIQCDKCQHSFCLECINKLSKCPMGCQNYQFNESQLCKELLSGIKIKCKKCGNEINYDNIEKHIDEECESDKIDYKERYLELKKEYKKLKDEINNPKESNEVEGIGYIKSYVHKHPIHIMKHFGAGWICDLCENSFNEDIPTYNCSLCDFDVCYNCVKDKITKGTIHYNMKNFYDNEL